jgi:hypothetical protein
MVYNDDLEAMGRERWAIKCVKAFAQDVRAIACGDDDGKVEFRRVVLVGAGLGV